MTTKTITPNNQRDKKKIGEISRLKRVMSELNIQPVDIYNETGVSERTIKNCIYDNIPIGGKLLRALHSNYSVSIDWLLSGSGHMMTTSNNLSEDKAVYSNENPRTERIISFINDWMSYADPDEQAWLETQLKFNLSQYQNYLKDKKED